MRKSVLARKSVLVTAAVGIGALLLLGACEGDGPEAQGKEREIQQSNYERLSAAEPALQAQDPMTRRTVNFWTETWGNEPGKLSYVYLMASNGQLTGYYIFEGLPVSYCVSLTPPYRFERPYSGNGQNGHEVQAPAMDGVFYSGQGCTVLYGKDATTGSYLEFSVGNGMNYLLYEQPLPRQDVEPLGFTRVEDVG